MSEGWFETIDSESSLTQGDIITDCPVVGWSDEPHDFQEVSVDELMAINMAFRTDAIVMSQACDLEQRKVDKVILCPCELLKTFRDAWEEDMRSRDQHPSEKAFGKFCRSVVSGHVWNYAILNRSGSGDDHRIVDFHEVYTIPRAFLDQLIAGRRGTRHRLRSPYREHVSQSFARFFMRVGLPGGISGLPPS